MGECLKETLEDAGRKADWRATAVPGEGRLGAPVSSGGLSTSKANPRAHGGCRLGATEGHLGLTVGLLRGIKGVRRVRLLLGEPQGWGAAQPLGDINTNHQFILKGLVLNGQDLLTFNGPHQGPQCGEVVLGEVNRGHRRLFM